MKKITLLLFFASAIFMVSCNNKTSNTSDQQIKPTEVYEVSVNNPTDITYNFARKEYCISSSDGDVFSLDSNFNIVKKTFIENAELVSIAYHKSSLLLADRHTNRFYSIILPAYRLTKKNMRIIGISANERSEVRGIAYVYCNDQWFISQQNDKTKINKYDGEFHFLEKKNINDIADLTSSDSYKCTLIMLGEDGTIYEYNNEELRVERSWKTGINNSEGICSDDDDNIYILSLESKIYKFDSELFN